MAATLFDEWVRCGLRDVVLCPGSRSTPLALAAARRSEVVLHVRLDERSAAFFALGRALVTGRPVAVVVTSGTAVAELHAAVAEADLAGVPLLVVSSDRPPELHGVGAAQTIDQRAIFGAMVRRFDDPGVARDDAAASWRPLAGRLWAAATGAHPGPVHLNVPLVEPLTEAPRDLPASRGTGAWLEAPPAAAASAVLDVGGGRVLCVVGAGVSRATVAECHALGWAVLGDATAIGTIPYFDALLRDDHFAQVAAPDVVVRLGGTPASKSLAERLRTWGAPVVGLTTGRPVADPDGVVGRLLVGAPDRGCATQRGDARYAAWWSGAAQRVAAWLEDVETTRVLDEPSVARAVVRASSRHDVALVVGSSMPVRDVEWWAPARTTTTFANRGANGIDGVVSTVLGVASGDRALGLVGDLTLLHDVSALVEGVGEDTTAVLVVIDNAGGGIFSFLAQARDLDESTFERLFATPRPHDLVAVARAFGHHAARVVDVGALERAVDEGLARPGLSVVVAGVPERSRNVAVHDALVAGVAAHWEEG